MHTLHLITEIERPRSIVRVVGAAGNGKTRTVLEALRRSALSTQVLYAGQVEEVPHSFIAHLSRTPDIQCSLVIDEVDDNDAERLRNYFSSMPQGVRLVMIGLDASGRAQPETLQVEGASDDLLAEMILAIVPGLQPDIARSIAHDCERSPKLAVIIAGRIKEDPSLVTSHRLLADRTVQNALDRYLKINPNTSEWQALSVTALLIRLGWKDEVEYESERLFQAVGLDPLLARRQVALSHERYGIAPLAGRFRYISPAILADHLASRQLNDWTRDRLNSFLSALTPAMTESFVRRARRFSTVLENRRAIEEVILGDQGSFRNLDELESSPVTALLRHLAGPFPQATLQALHRIIAPASIEDLRTAKNSRRDLVWALEELLWLESTFERAADLLLRLAIAENETWGNNATNTWIETFQTWLGRTAANAVVRARVLQRAALHTDPIAREICAKAIGRAFEVEHLSRSGMPPQDVEGMPEQEWRPATKVELAEAITSYLGILESLLLDSVVPVRQAATEALGQALTVTFQLPPQVLEEWMRVARLLITADFSLRNPLLMGISWAKERFEYFIQEEFDKQPDERMDPSNLQTVISLTRERLALLDSLATELRGDDFSSRLRWAITAPLKSVSADDRLEEENELRTRLESIATEALAQPTLINSELDWLLNTEGKDFWHIITWFQVLGRMDKERLFAPALDSHATNSPNAIMVISLYDLSYAQTFDLSFIERRANELRVAGASPMRIFDLLFRAGFSSSRFPQMLELFTSNSIAATLINQLAYHPWGPQMQSGEALQLAEAVENCATSPVEIIPFVYRYLRQVKEAISCFRELSLRLLLAPTVEQEGRGVDDEWPELALIYVSEKPIEIVDAALQRINGRRVASNHDLYKVLHKAWEIGDKARIFTEVFTPWLTRDTSNLIFASFEGKHCFPISELGVEFLADWISAEPKKRAWLVAKLIGAPVPSSRLHATLLERFDEYGVGNTFAADFRSGSYVGNTSDWIGVKLGVVRQLIDDEHSAIRNWAREVASGLEKELHHQRSLEEEERFL